jgi:Leucine-rich repeat (LRR) protein
MLGGVFPLQEACFWTSYHHWSAAEFTQSLPISHNKLQGQIPEVFGELKGLEYLDLPYNNSSAMIPTSLKGLLHLEYLIYLPINYKEESQMEELHRT